MRGPRSADPPPPPRRAEEGEPTIFVADEQHDRPVELDRWERLASAVLRDEGVAGDAELTLLFVDETTIAELNGRFMGSAGPTDVLAFPLDAQDPPKPGRDPDGGTSGPMRDPFFEDGSPPLLLGDVVVCPTVAARNAEERGVAVDDEIALLVVHGILHVMGHDHAEPEETAIMRAREVELLSRHHRGGG